MTIKVRAPAPGREGGRAASARLGLALLALSLSLLLAACGASDQAPDVRQGEGTVEPHRREVPSPRPDTQRPDTQRQGAAMPGDRGADARVGEDRFRPDPVPGMGRFEPSAPPPPALGTNAASVALLLPLSGPRADIGQALLNAAQLALFDVAGEAFTLMPLDTRGTAAGARLAAEEAVRNGAELILGPVFADCVAAAGTVARRAGVNLIGFSTDWTLAGDNVFIMGFLPFAQVSRVVSFARDRQIGRIGLVVAPDSYGDAVIGTAREVLSRAGAPEPVVAQLSSTDSVEEALRRFTAYDERLAALEDTRARLAADPDPASQRALDRLAQAETYGPPPFEAVLIALGGEMLRRVASQIAFYDIDPRRVQFLGTGLWDEPGLGRDPALLGGWFAAPDPQARRRFEQRYRATYNEVPLRLATLAYDATALAAVLARTPGPGRFARERLTNPSGFIGIDGVFRFLPSGEVQRALPVLEVGSQGPRVIDPAPQSFGGPIN